MIIIEDPAFFGLPSMNPSDPSLVVNVKFLFVVNVSDLIEDLNCFFKFSLIGNQIPNEKYQNISIDHALTNLGDSLMK